MSARDTYLVDDGRRLVTSSEISSFGGGCMRRWYLGTYRGLVPVGGPALFGHSVLGSRVHLALERWYDPAQSQFDDAAALAVHEASVQEALVKAAGNERATKHVQTDAALGQIMLEGYFEWCRETGVLQIWDVLAVERRTRVAFREATELHPAVDLMAKMDLEFQDKRTGATRFVDFKTAQDADRLLKLARIAPQFRHYAMVQLLKLRADGVEDAWTDGGIYHVLRKVKRGPTARPPFYVHHEVRITLAQLRSYWLQVTGVVERLLATEARLAAGGDHRELCPPAPSTDCIWKCEFFAVCPVLDDVGRDGEGFLTEWFTVADPLARYRAPEPVPHADTG